MSSFVPGLEFTAAVGEAITDDLIDIADDIAAGARRGYQQHELKTANPKNGVIVEAGPEGVRVVTYNPFAHLDEWGSINNRPSGAMRSAAAAKGNYRPEGK